MSAVSTIHHLLLQQRRQYLSFLNHLAFFSLPQFLQDNYFGSEIIAFSANNSRSRPYFHLGSSNRQNQSVQSLRRIRLFVTPWTAAHQAPLSITNSQSLLKLMSIELVMLSNHLILCHSLLLPPSNLSQHQGLFRRVSSSHQVAEVLELQLQHQPFQ